MRHFVAVLGLSLAASACNTTTDCAPGEDGGATTLHDGSASIGNLGTTGTHFAGTACWCDTTTSAEEATYFSVSSTGGGLTTIDHRLTSSAGCEVWANSPGGVQKLVTLGVDGTATIPNEKPFGVIGLPSFTWTCEDGSFRVHTSQPFRANGRTVTLSAELYVSPPQCASFACAPALTCASSGYCTDPAGPTSTICVDDSQCTSGLTCKADGAFMTCQ